MTPSGIIDLLGLEPLADEGGWWTQTLLDEHSSAIYYLLTPEGFSALHRLPGPEVYHHYAGAPAELTTISPTGDMSTIVLGDDLDRGERPVAVIDGGSWQGSRTTGDWSLLGTTMAPAFRSEDFQLADRAELTARYPEAARHIRDLTRWPDGNRTAPHDPRG